MPTRSFLVPETPSGPVVLAFGTATRASLAKIDQASLSAAIERGDSTAILTAMGITPGAIPEMEASLGTEFYERLKQVYFAIAQGALDALALRALLSDVVGPYEILITQLIQTYTRQSAEVVTQSVSKTLDLELDSDILTGLLMGYVGLTANQANSLYIFAGVLSRAMQRPGATISPLQMRFLNAAQRAQLIKALATGKLDSPTVRALIVRQAGDLFTQRALGVAVTAITTVSGLGAETAIREGIKSGKLPAGSFRKSWRTRGDERVRFDHSATESMNATGRAVDEPFQTPFGPVSGPPLEINCRCRVEWTRKVTT
jgi:hypothetical protein